MVIKKGESAPEARVYSCTRCGYLSALLKDELAGSCPNCEVIGKKYSWQPTHHELVLRTKNIAQEVKARSTWSDKFSDKITSFCGNMWFVYVHVVWFSLWLWYNLTSPTPFDPFPFGLLTLIVSLEAILLATFILISQNREAEISGLRSELDYQVDLKTEKIISEIRVALQEVRADLSKHHKKKK